MQPNAATSKPSHTKTSHKRPVNIKTHVQAAYSDGLIKYVHTQNMFIQTFDTNWAAIQPSLPLPMPCLEIMYGIWVSKKSKIYRYSLNKVL